MSPGRQLPELPPHYYRDNFLSLLDTVEGQYGDILTAEECAFLSSYRELGFDAQCLYVRLVSRVGPWFRESRLHYPELGSLRIALDELVTKGLAQHAETLSPGELGRLCTAAELASLFGVRAVDKAALIGVIDDLGLEGAELVSVLVAADGARVVAPAALEKVSLLQLLFFGNRHQGLTEFVLSDLGVARYYPYPLDRSQRLFPNREALEEFLDYAARADQWQQLREDDDEAGMCDLASSLLHTVTRYPASEQRCYRLCNRVARHLERLGESQLALSLYQRSQRHPARERAARLLERGGDYVAAETLCEEIETAPWCEEERDAARRILPRVRRKIHGAGQRVTRDAFAEIALSLSRGEASVEVLAAENLQGQWRQVHYVENRLMNALFGLAFWEQIFLPVPGAFNNPYQSVPADMYEQQFRGSRAAAIGERLAELSRIPLDRELIRCWRAYEGFQCRWVNWKAVGEELVAAATAVIPSKHLLAIWQRVLFDPGENRRGFPDLLALGSRPGQYRLIEVKGPGDTLQESQKRWLRFFRQEGIPAAVARVQWLDG